MIKRISISICFLLLIGSVSQAALIHHWKLDEWTGTTAVDSVGGQNGTIKNNVVLGVPGRINSAMSFPGQNTSGIDTGSTTVLPATEPFSLFAFIKTTAHTASQGHIFSNHNASLVNRSNFGVNNGLLFWFHSGGLGAVQAGTDPVNDGKWHLVGVTRDTSNDWNLWIDETAYPVGTSATALGTTLKWHIGTNGAENQFPFNGVIDDVRVYNEALSGSQILKTRAFNPTPVDGMAAVDVLTASLQWNTGLEATLTHPNPAITKHYVYIGNEPNFIGMTPVVITASGATGSHWPLLVTDKTYYWRVDESINNSAPTDPNTITGITWSFETIKSVPVITQQPQNVLVGTGGTAVFTIGATSISPAVYTWYKVVEDADDMVVAGPTLDGDTLTLLNVQITDEGHYYCKIVNASGEENAVYSNVVSLGIPRIMAHWTLDQTKYVANQYVDETGRYYADPNNPAMVSFVAGQKGEAVQMGNEGAWAKAGSWRPNAYTGQMTVSAWFKLTGTISGDGQGIVSKRNANGLDWSLYIRGGDGSHTGNNYVRFTSFAGGDVWAGPNAVVSNEWVHIVAVVDSSNAGRVYINGLQKAVDGTWVFGPNATAEILLGKGTPTAYVLPGQLDDVKIYNYGLSALDVAAMYTADDPTKTICLPSERPDVKYDRNGNCKVELADFLEFVGDWLDCGFIPQSACD